MPETHNLTIRLPDAVYQAARQLAEREGVSLNRLVAEALADRDRRSTKGQLRDAYDELGRDLAEADSERFISLQAEALLAGSGRAASAPSTSRPRTPCRPPPA